MYRTLSPMASDWDWRNSVVCPARVPWRSELFFACGLEQAFQLADQVGQLGLVLLEFAGLFLNRRDLRAKLVDLYCALLATSSSCSLAF